MTVAIATVHRKNGFFIFNKARGVEYTLGIAVMALVPATFGAGRYSPRQSVAPLALVAGD